MYKFKKIGLISLIVFVILASSCSAFADNENQYTTSPEAIEQTQKIEDVDKQKENSTEENGVESSSSAGIEEMGEQTPQEVPVEKATITVNKKVKDGSKMLSFSLIEKEGGQYDVDFDVKKESNNNVKLSFTKNDQGVWELTNVDSFTSPWHEIVLIAIAVLIGIGVSFLGVVILNKRRG